MTKTAYVKARLEPEVKQKAEDIFKKLGLSASEAINLYYQQVAYKNGLPFELRVPTDETLETITNIANRSNLKGFKSVDDLYKDLGI